MITNSWLKVLLIDPLLLSVRRPSELSAAPDEHLVRTPDGVHAVAGVLEESHHVACLRAFSSCLLPRLHHLTQQQGTLHTILHTTLFFILPSFFKCQHDHKCSSFISNMFLLLNIHQRYPVFKGELFQTS